MPVRVACPQCSKSLSVEEDLADGAVRCPACGASIRVGGSVPSSENRSTVCPSVVESRVDSAPSSLQLGVTSGEAHVGGATKQEGKASECWVQLYCRVDAGTSPTQDQRDGCPMQGDIAVAARPDAGPDRPRRGRARCPRLPRLQVSWLSPALSAGPTRAAGWSVTNRAG
jgi:hypothetical protein